MDVLVSLDNKESEINAWLDDSNRRHDKLVFELNELDASMQEARDDLRRINEARNAIHGADEPMMSRGDRATSAPVSGRLPARYARERGREGKIGVSDG